MSPLGPGVHAEPNLEIDEIARFRLPARWDQVMRMVNAIYESKYDESGREGWIGMDSVAGELTMNFQQVQLVPGCDPVAFLVLTFESKQGGG